MPSDISSIKPVLDVNSQSHLYKFWEDLSPADQDKYFNELVSLNTQRVNSAFQDALKVSENSCFVDGRLMCPDPSTCGHETSLRLCYPDEYERFVSKGLKAISERKVAVILLAGGQGTRLESTNPKGMYDIGLPSRRTLFQLQAERLLSLCRQVSAKCGQEICIPWYIMTSDQTQKLTEDFFRKNGYFNYPEEHIIFFEQFDMPVLSFQGKILMKDKASLCWSPEGNGGLYRALLDRGILQNMRARGIDYVHIYGVDNVLVRLADPAFIGFCISRAADCAVKVVEKTDPAEPIGVVGVVDGKFRVVEYSEISPSTAALVLPMPPSRMACCQDEKDCNSKLAKSRLLYCHGNICNHFMTLTFLKRVCNPELESQLPYHVARKKVSHIDLETGTTITPTQPNALKLEKFIFDVFQFSQRFAIWEVDRATEFSPLKNRSGAQNDCPETCRQSILNLHASWARAAGAVFASEDNINRDVIEISPLVSLNGENLGCLKGKTITGVNVLELRRSEDGEDVPTLIQVKANN